MSTFEWRMEYETGNEHIDHQHMQLMDLAMQLHVAVGLGKEQLVVKPAFEALLAYTKQHFIEEEELFASMNSSKLEEHKQAHKTLEEEVQALWQEDSMGLEENMGHKLEQWVEKRLIPHMTVDDQAALANK